MNSRSMARFLSSVARRTRPELSAMAKTRVTPTDWSPSITLRTMFTFSQSGTTRPWATSRRMSLLAAGFAIIPTRAKGCHLGLIYGKRFMGSSVGRWCADALAVIIAPFIRLAHACR